MKTQGFFARVYWLSEWVMRFLWIELLWILFTLLGLVVFGVMPATAAMFAVSQKWASGDTDFPSFSLFWEVYKAEFIKINLLGLSMMVVGIILYVDYLFLHAHHSIIFQILKLGLIVFTIMYMFTLLYLFPVFSHYKMSNIQVVKYALFIGLNHPFRTIVMWTILIFMILIVRGLLPFLSIGGLSFLVMKSSYKAFQKLNDSAKLENM